MSSKNGKGKSGKITAEDLFGNENEKEKDEKNEGDVVQETEIVDETVKAVVEDKVGEQLELKDTKEVMQEIEKKELPEELKEAKEIENNVGATFENIISQPAPADKIAIGDNDVVGDDDAFSPTEEEMQQVATQENNVYNKIIGGFEKMAEQAQVGVTMDKAGVIRTFRFSEAIKMVVGNNYSDDVVFRGDITPQKLVEMAKGNTDIAAKISEEMYLKGIMPVAWLISLKPDNYITVGETQPHILQGGNFNKQTVDVNKIVANYGEYMVKGADGTVTPYIDAEPFSHMMGTASITAILSAKRIFGKLAKMVADAEGIENHKYRLGITLNPQSPKDSLVVLTVLSPMGNTLIK